MSFRSFRILAWIAAWLLLIEVGLEARAHSRGWETLLFGDVTPEAETAESEFGPTDDFPFRSRIVPRDKPAGRTRVWLGSSSYAEDVRQPPDRLFCALAEQALRDGGVDVELLNSSRGGMTSVDNVRDLVDQAGPWDVDVAVLYQMTNDIDALTRFVFEGSPEADEVVDEDLRTVFALSRDEEPAAPAEVVPPINERAMSSIQRVFEATSTYAQLKNQITSRLTRGRVLAARLGDEGNALFVERVVTFLDACDDAGVRPVLCTFATSHVPATIDEMPSDTVDNLFRYNIHLAVRGWMASVAELNDALRELASARDVALIDVDAAITGRAELFRDFTHFTREGHAAVAEVFAAGLAEALAR